VRFPPVTSASARKNSVTVNPNARTSLTSPSLSGTDEPWSLPHQVLVVPEVREARAVVEQDHARPAGDEPAAEVTRDALRAQPVERLADDAFGRALLELQRRGRRVVRADQAVAIVPAIDHAVGLGAQHGVDPAELPANFPADFKEHRRLVKTATARPRAVPGIGRRFRAHRRDGGATTTPARAVRGGVCKRSRRRRHHRRRRRGRRHRSRR
jgi:hypothetical protein